MKWKHKSWITIWLILVCAALVVTGTYAAYTKVEYVKRVVATKNMLQTELFSSNHLLLRSDGNDYPLRMIPVGTQSNVSVMVSVCNYLQSDITRVNDDTITYTFSAQLMDIQGNPIKSDTEITYQTGEGTETTTTTITGRRLAEIIQIRKNGAAVLANVTANSITYSLPEGSETLAGGVESANFYEVFCPQEYIPVLNAIAIRMKADPGENHKKLVGELWLGTNYQQLTAWNGKFVGLPNDGSTESYDAFNYEIYGMKQQRLRVCWNPQRVTLGKWSREQFTGAIVGADYIEIDVGAPGTPKSYTLQFYRVDGIPPNETASDVRGTSEKLGYVYIGQ